KPDGLCVIRPGEGAAFVAGLPVRRFHGVGPRGAEKMARLGIETGADLAAKDIGFLREHFGSFAEYLYRAARGIDLRPVRANRIRKSLGSERTFFEDLSSGTALREALDNIIDIVWAQIAEKQLRGRTVTLKMKYTDFRITTRARSLPRAVADKAEFAHTARALLDEQMPLPLPIRLMGVTLSSLEGERDDRPRDEAQRSLLEECRAVREPARWAAVERVRRPIWAEAFGGDDFPPVRSRRSGNPRDKDVQAVHRAGVRLGDVGQLMQAGEPTAQLFAELALRRHVRALVPANTAAG